MEKKENKKMKKGLTIAALALLLGIVGYTGGNTFAKYITGAELPAQNATVARWGFTASVSYEDSLVGSDYTGSDLATKTEDGVAVDASNLVVAPGTTGSMTVSVAGDAEVRAQITFEATFDGVSLTKDGKVYNPIVYTVKQGEETKTFNTAEALNAHLNGLSVIYEAGATAVSINLEISWAWALNNDSSLNNITDLTIDEADTYLGTNYDQEGYTADNQASFGLKVSIVQIQ